MDSPHSGGRGRCRVLPSRITSRSGLRIGNPTGGNPPCLNGTLECLSPEIDVSGLAEGIHLL